MATTNQSSSSAAAATSMELVSLKPSPYSRRIRWALQLLNINYRTTEYESMSGEPALRWRLGRFNLCKPVTVPVAFITTTITTTDEDKPHQVLQLENGFDIVEWADDFASEKKDNSNNNDRNIIRLVPPSLRSQVIEYCNIADEIQNYGRKIFVDAVSEDPSLLRVFLGDDDGPPDRALPIIGFIVSSYMTTKYRSTFHQNTTTEMKDLLNELQNHILAAKKKNKKKSIRDGSLSSSSSSKDDDDDDGITIYSVGNSLTLADLYLCVAIYDGQPGGSSNNDDEKAVLRYKKLKEATIRHSFDIETEFPVLYDWAKSIRVKHGVEKI